MSRPLRIQFSGAIYHVMNRGIARQKMFIETADYEDFLKTIAETHELRGMEVTEQWDGLVTGRGKNEEG